VRCKASSIASTLTVACRDCKNENRISTGWQSRPKHNNLTNNIKSHEPINYLHGLHFIKCSKNVNLSFRIQSSVLQWFHGIPHLFCNPLFLLSVQFLPPTTTLFSKLKILTDKQQPKYNVVTNIFLPHPRHAKVQNSAWHHFRLYNPSFEDLSSLLARPNTSYIWSKI